MPKTTGTKTAASTIMDDAPLFAGLEGFVQIKVEEKKAEQPKKAVPPKVKSAKRQTRPAAAGEAQPQKQPKAPRPQQPSDPNSILLSVAEMCILLRISRATLIRMDKSGKIPGRIKLGGSVRFHRETVEAWLKNLITPAVT
jgi:excisionase family DNA binding protein